MDHTLYFKNQTEDVPEILSNYFKNKTKVQRDSFKILHKQDPEEVIKILSNYFKKRTQRISELLSNCLQKGAQKNPRDSFQLIQKQDKGSLRVLQQTASKTRPTEGAQESFKKKTYAINEILSNYFKNKIQRGASRFFQTTSKRKHKGYPKFFQIV